MQFILSLHCSITQDELTSWPEEHIREWFENWGIIYSVLSRSKRRRLGIGGVASQSIFIPEYPNVIDYTEFIPGEVVE